MKELSEKKERPPQRGAEQKAPKLSVSVLMQSRASFSNGEVVVDGIFEGFSVESGAEDQVLELRYKGQSTVCTETGLRNIIVLIPKRKGIDRLEQTRGICVQSSWPSGVVDVSDADF